MKRYLLVITWLGISLGLFAQVDMTAEREHLAVLPISERGIAVQYKYDEEGFYTLESPMVDHEGRLLFYPSYSRDALIVFDKGEWKREPLLAFQASWRTSQFLFSSSMGYAWSQDMGYVLDRNKAIMFAPQCRIKNLPPSMKVFGYPIPSGSVTISLDPTYLYSTQVQSSGDIVVRTLSETKAWLPSQPGGFSIGDDGKLYRSGMLWSAVPPPPGHWAERYTGKLMSGHNIWVGEGMHGQEKTICISNSQGDLELKMDIPWGYKPDFDPEIFRMFDYGVGPWGELYYLIAPKEYLNPQPGDVAELVVVRNHLKYFGRLNDKDVRLRDQPGTGGKVLGTFPAKTGFRILERSGKQETIGGQTSDWVKVRLLDGRVGWFFGAFVHSLYDGPNGLPPPWPNVADW